MKRIFLSSLFFIAFLCMSFAQVLTINISGYVCNIGTNAMIPNHQVTISSDSTVAPYFSYQTVVTTNSNGIFHANIPLSNPGVQIEFIVTTSNCDGSVITKSIWYHPGYTAYYFGLFTNCGNTGAPCVAGFTATPCSNTTNCMNFQSTSTPTPLNYFWEFGDGSSAFQTANPVHTYAQAGTYNVSLKVYSSNGCGDSIYQTVVVQGSTLPCVASYTATASTSNSQLYYFQNTSTPSAQYTCYWHFGDGSVGTGNAITHNYSQTGTYLACLYIVNQATNCYDSVCQTITVVTQPQPCNAAFTFGPCVITVVNCVQFHATPSPAGIAMQYLWTFGDGTGISTIADPSHTFAQAGTYNVCLRIWTANGCSDSICQAVTIPGTPPPCSANFMVTPCMNTSTGCFNFQAIAPVSALQYYWYFGDGGYATGASVTHTYQQSGTYTACLHVYNQATGCYDSVCQAITVVTQPQPCNAAFTFGPCVITVVNCVQFHATPSPAGIAMQYLWTFGDGTGISTIADPSHTFAQAGTYNVCLRIWTANGCSDSICQAVTIPGTPPPCSANFTVMPCSTPNICFHFIAINQNPTTQYFWTFGDSLGTDTTATATYNYAQAGIYLVCLKIVTADGCTDSVCQLVTAGNVPLYDISGQVYAGNNLLDHGKARLFRVNGTYAAQLYATTTVDSTGTYHFNGIPAGTYFVKARPGINSQYFGQYFPTYYPHNAYWGNATPIVIPPVNNPYDISLKHVISPISGPGHIGGFIMQGAKFSAKGDPAPDEDIFLEPVSGDPYIFTTSDNAGEFGFDNLGYGTYKIYAEVAGLSTMPAVVTISATNPSTSNISLVITPSQVVTGIETTDEAIGQYNLYPNPANNEINLELSSSISSDAILVITDLPGRQLNSMNIAVTKGLNKIALDLSRLDSGSYLLLLKTSQGTISRKFVVVK